MLGLTAALVDKSLVVLDPELLGQARYRMLDTIREYAALRLSQAGEAAVFRGRFRDYAMRTSEHSQALGMARIEAPWPARVDVFRRYDVDAGNVIQILNWCLEQGDAEAGLRICAAVSPCWIVWGTFGEGGEWLRSFLALDMAGVPAWVQGAATVVRGQLTLSSDPATASVAVMRRIDQQWGAARALLGLGDLARFRNHPGEAHGWYVEALAILREIGARPEIARCLAGLGRVAAAPPSSLTQREYEIAELVAGGLSNKAIAAELSISHTTAARHVANIMGKLGFNSRSQIAAWVADRAQGPGRAGDPGERG